MKTIYFADTIESLLCTVSNNVWHPFILGEHKIYILKNNIVVSKENALDKIQSHSSQTFLNTLQRYMQQFRSSTKHNEHPKPDASLWFHVPLMYSTF